ncbi:MAG: terminase small subunit [Planctomycetota bacterium]|jgi:hypothetical protein
MNADKNQRPPANDEANMPKREHQKATKRRKAVERTGKRPFAVKQQRFIDSYAGDIKEAAQKAELSYDYARKLVTKRHILQAIRNRQETEVRPKDIADRQERQAFWTAIKRLPNRMPTLRGFAKHIGVDYTALYDWLKEGGRTYHEEFANAFMCAQEIRKEWLIDLGLSGLTPPLAYKFTAINCTDMRGQKNIQVGGSVKIILEDDEE